MQYTTKSVWNRSHLTFLSFLLSLINCTYRHQQQHNNNNKSRAWYKIIDVKSSYYDIILFTVCSLPVSRIREGRNWNNDWWFRISISSTTVGSLATARLQWYTKQHTLSAEEEKVSKKKKKWATSERTSNKELQDRFERKT